MNAGSGGLGAVSVGLPAWLLIVILIMVLAFGVWKLAKLLWAMFGS